MFENVFSFFKSSKEESTPAQQEQTWNATSMTMEQPANYTANQQTQPASPEQMKLRGGGEGGDICCGICAGIACFECCEICC